MFEAGDLVKIVESAGGFGGYGLIIQLKNYPKKDEPPNMIFLSRKQFYEIPGIYIEENIVFYPHIQSFCEGHNSYLCKVTSS